MLSNCRLQWTSFSNFDIRHLDQFALNGFDRWIKPLRDDSILIYWLQHQENMWLFWAELLRTFEEALNKACSNTHNSSGTHDCKRAKSVCALEPWGNLKPRTKVLVATRWFCHKGPLNLDKLNRSFQFCNALSNQVQGLLLQNTFVLKRPNMHSFPLSFWCPASSVITAFLRKKGGNIHNLWTRPYHFSFEPILNSMLYSRGDTWGHRIVH